ncbi:tail protein [Stutzerimonas stutzeri KOS6]|uniref:Tail protein n=2 Tax=Stutzerimonas stutzeri TaxID=316 RepID=A0A061JKN2_STUST|nr:tail protein [Stutzerimonas stutzeri KOS6]
MSSAAATGTRINLTHMAVGDGNGNPIAPDPHQTQLVRERYRAPVNRVYQSPEDPTRFTAEMVVPATVGGWTMRELAVFDAAGSMFVVGNLPDVYKPVPAEGSFGDAVLRLDFAVSNADVVNLLLDPAIAVASQAWVINNVTAAQIIPGGTVGQLLGKASNADGDYEWQDPNAINVTVDTVAEKQLLAAGQTLVDLSVTTTYGLAVYIEGLRIDMGSGADEWQPHATITTRVVLGKSYPADTRITLVNNEPAGSAPAPLERAKNLSDVLDKEQARTNLDIFSKAESRQMAPAGLVAHFARSTAPAGWLKANGAAVSRTAYAELYAAIGATFGAGDGFTTFNLPDLRGEFLRGWDDARGVDGGRALGSSQGGALQSHAHSGSSEDAGAHVHNGTAQSGGGHSHSASSSPAGGHSHTQTLAVNNSSGSDGGYATDGYGGTKASQASNPVDDHTHSISIGTAGSHEHALTIQTAGTHSHDITIGATGGAETRPRNVALLACIKF